MVKRAGGFERLSSFDATEFVKQSLCFFQIGRVEAFSEPAVDRREEIAGFAAAALVAAEPGEARSGTQFPELGPLLLSDAQGLAIQFLGSLGRCSSRPFSLFSSAANQRSPVLLTICKASSNRVTPSSIFPEIPQVLARRAI